jgi:succinoglycan biosynthesis transport protein ExoP
MHISTSPDLKHLVAVARRQAWIVILVMIVCGALGYAYCQAQTRLYGATSQVLISTSNVANELTNTQPSDASAEQDSLMATQLELAQDTSIMSNALDLLPRRDRISLTTFQTIGSVSEAPLADILTFTANAASRQQARALANAWATAFSNFRRTLDTQSIAQALRDDDQQIASLQKASSDKSQAAEVTPGLISNLRAKAQQLRTLIALQTSNAPVVQRATVTKLVQPKTGRTLGLTLFIGLVLGLLLAVWREGVSVRLTSPDEVEDVLGMTLLSRIPSPRLPSDPYAVTEQSPYAEAVRTLRTYVDRAMQEASQTTLLVCSAIAGEGKSTTAANLAVALARSGRKVVLVDADLRRPRLRQMFDIKQPAGLTDVVLGNVELAAVLTPMPLARDDGEVWSEFGGSLQLLPAGLLPPDPSELFTSLEFRRIVAELTAAAEYVIFDAAPFVGLGDSIVLANQIDVLLFVSRLRAADRRVLREMRRITERVRAVSLGFVTSGEKPADVLYGYDAYAYKYEPAETGPDVAEGREGSTL